MLHSASNNKYFIGYISSVLCTPVLLCQILGKGVAPSGDAVAHAHFVFMGMDARVWAAGVC